jgi:hypothetical protein
MVCSAHIVIASEAWRSRATRTAVAVALDRFAKRLAMTTGNR